MLPIASICDLFDAANWMEREVGEKKVFNIFFLNNNK